MFMSCSDVQIDLSSGTHETVHEDSVFLLIAWIHKNKIVHSVIVLTLVTAEYMQASYSTESLQVKPLFVDFRALSSIFIWCQLICIWVFTFRFICSGAAFY